MIRKSHTLAMAVLLLAPVATQAATLDVGARVLFIERGTPTNPLADLFIISNSSDAGANIVDVTIDLTLATDAPVFDTLDGCTLYCFGQQTGYPVVAVGGMGDTGFVMPTAADQVAWEESPTISLNFTDFEGGESLVLATDVDDLVNFFITPDQLIAASIAVTFDGPGINAVTLMANFSPVPGGPKWDAAATVEGMATVIPVPGALLLFSSALLGLAARGRRRSTA